MSPRDYSPLRELAATRETVRLKSSTVFELLDELETLRAAAAPAKMKRNDYPPEFEEVWMAYPTRPGASKRATFKAWSARRKAGVVTETMLAGAVAYAAYIKVTDQHIKLPETFFGPDEHYASDWTPPEVIKKPSGAAAAWWLSDASILTKGTELGLRPHPGEAMPNFKGRIQATLDNGGVPPAPLAPTQMPAAQSRQVSSPEQRAAKPEGMGRLSDLVKRVAMPLPSAN